MRFRRTYKTYSPKSDIEVLGMRQATLLTLAFVVAAVSGGIFYTAAKEKAPVFFAGVFERPYQTAQVIDSFKTDAVKILFVGDMSFDRHIREVGDKHGSDFLFSCVDGLLGSVDFAVGNLEGPITEHESTSLGSKVGSPENFIFTFPPSTGELLARHHFKLVNIGNNHIDDFGFDGLHTTRGFLKEAGVDSFGGLQADEPIARIVVGKRTVSFISYNQFGGIGPEEVARKIIEEKSQDRTVIVYAHWGEEYTEPTQSVRSTARLFAESGADVIIGSHPHVVQEHEYIGKTLVYYSLGNFIFDQYWNEYVSRGLTLLMEISADQISVDEYPVQISYNGLTCLK